MKSKKSIFTFCTILLLVLLTSNLKAQCQNWHNSANQDSLEDAYVHYRSLMKQGQNTLAFPHWELVYQNAPAADGTRSMVYSDGRKLLLEKFQQAKNRKEKKDLAQFILRLMEEEQKCYPKSTLEQLPKEILKYRSEVE